MAIVTNELIDVQKLTPFKKFVMSIGQIPTSYLESMSYAELLMWFCNYLQNTVIPTVNNNGEAVEELQNAFITFAQAVNDEIERFETGITTDFDNLEDFVNNYFDNNFPALVQSALDEMAEDGTLRDILAEMLKVQNYVILDNYNVLTNHQNLTPNMYVKLKNYESNDKIESVYYVKTQNSEVINNKDIISLQNDLIGILEPSMMKELNSKIFGDTSTQNVNDSEFLQYLFTYACNNNIKVKLLNKQYNIGSRIEIKSNFELDMNNATFKLNDHADCEMLYNYDNISTQTSYIDNIKIYNGTINGNSEYNHAENNSGIFLSIVYSNNLTVENMTITNCERIPLNIKLSKNITIKNINFSDIALYNSTYINGGNYAIAIEGNNSITSENLTIENVTLNNYSSGGFHLYKVKNGLLKNVSITGGLSSPKNSDPITYTNCNNIVSSSLTIDTATNCGLEINQESTYLTFNNCKITNATTGLIISNNNVANTINKHIEFNNSTINASGSYLALINYTNGIYFNNCDTNGYLGGNTDINNIKFNDCIMTGMNFQNFSPSQVTSFNNCDITTIDDVHYIVNEYSASNHLINITTSGSVTANSSVDVPMYLLFKNVFGLVLSLCGYFDGNRTQNYQGAYLLTTISGTNANCKLSTKIYGNGDSVRELVPSLSATDGKLTITNSQSVNEMFILNIKN